ncbi:MAG: hypothetical protein ACTS6J_13750, partial [Burkholderiales bacterium]
RHDQLGGHNRQSGAPVAEVGSGNHVTGRFIWRVRCDWLSSWKQFAKIVWDGRYRPSKSEDDF